MEIDITKHGMQHYQEILAIIFRYFEIVRDDWLDEKNGADYIPLFKECQTIAQLSFIVGSYQTTNKFEMLLRLLSLRYHSAPYFIE